MADPALLVYTRTTGYRHDSILAGVAALRALGGFEVHAHEDPAALEEPLDRYAAVVFLSTSGEVLTPAGRERLAAYVEGGGGFVGVHAAACTEDDWPYYGDLLGARFAGHPGPARARPRGGPRPPGDPAPASRLGGDRRVVRLRACPRRTAHVLLRADESSYTGGTMGDDHPLAWCRAQGAGRVFYTALGHTVEAYDDPLFRAHLRGGITWAAAR